MLLPQPAPSPRAPAPQISIDGGATGKLTVPGSTHAHDALPEWVFPVTAVAGAAALTVLVAGCFICRRRRGRGRRSVFGGSRAYKSHLDEIAPLPPLGPLPPLHPGVGTRTGPLSNASAVVASPLQMTEMSQPVAMVVSGEQHNGGREGRV